MACVFHDKSADIICRLLFYDTSILTVDYDKQFFTGTGVF